MNYKVIHTQVIKVSFLASYYSTLASYVSLILFLFLQLIGIQGYGQTINPNYVDGKIYVKIKNSDTTQLPMYDTSMSITILDSTFQSLKNTYGIIRIEKAFQPFGNPIVDKVYRISIGNFNLIDTMVHDISLLSYIDYAEKIPLDLTFCTNEQTGYWGIPAQRYHLDLVEACNAWGIGTGTNDRRIAILDSEFDLNHQDLVQKLSLPPNPCSTNVWDVSDNDNNLAGPGTFDHGTHVAAIAGADTDNGWGVASLSRNVPIVLVKVAHDNAGQAITHGYEGILWAISNCADVINCSWGSLSYSTTNNNICQLAYNVNKIIVAAAGNDGINSNNSQPHYPAAYPNVVAVANTDINDNRHPSSCFGTWVDISAPGSAIYSALPTAIYGPNAYGFKTGTSMAAPLVAALCGLVWTSPGAIANNYTNQMVINCVLGSADNIDLQNPLFVGLLGSGRINAFQAMLCAQNPGIVVDFTQDAEVICEGTNINFTDASVVGGAAITNYNWTFPGGTPSTSNLQNPSISYNTSGTYPVTLTITVNGVNHTITNTNAVHVIGAASIQPAITTSICKGEEMQMVINTGANTNAGSFLNYNIVYGGIMGPIQTYSIASSIFSIYFDTDPILNTMLHVNTIQANLAQPLVCTLNIDIPIKTIDCCPNNLTVNGDFDLGWSNFVTQQAQVPVFSFVPGNANVQNGLFPGWVNIDRQNSMMIDGRALACGYPCMPIANNLAPYPSPTELCCGSSGYFPNQHSVLWQQNNITLDVNMNYKLSFFTTKGNNTASGGVQPLQLRVRVLDNNSNVVFASSAYTVPTYGQKEWYLYVVDIPFQSIPFSNTNYTISIEQYEYFQNQQYDFLLDEIHLFRYLPLELTSNLAGNNLQNLINGPGTITANSPQQYTTYSWSGPSGTPGFNTLTNVTAPGIYTCTATGAGGCTRTSTIQIFDLCNPPSAPIPGLWALNNATATDLINNFNAGNPNVTNPNIILINGTFTVDQSMSFINCPAIFLGDDAEIILNNGTTLNIDHSHLSAECYDMWKGIVADQLTESILIKNSTLRDMQLGVRAFNGAQIVSEGNLYIDNLLGIHLRNAPTGYNLASGKCRIIGNTFTSTGNPLLMPMSNINQGQHGIIVQECWEAEIGELVAPTLTPAMNVFNHLLNGIVHLPAPITTFENLKFFNNEFHNIHDPSPGLTLQGINNNTFTTYRGAAIFFASPGGLPLQNHYAMIDNNGDAGVIDNCDKAIIGSYISPTIRNVYVSNTPFGFRFTHADKQRIRIGEDVVVLGSPIGVGQNMLYNVMTGIEIIGNPAANSVPNYISGNTITLYNDPNLPLQWVQQGMVPTGIILSEVSQPYNVFSISDNMISTDFYVGTGIRLVATGANLNCLLNTINFQTTASFADPCFPNLPCYELIGIHVKKAIEGTVKGNDINGIIDLAAYNARQATGIKTEISTQIRLECNHINNTRYGFWVIDNCKTDNDETTNAVINNSFDNHRHAMYFSFGANEGTLNDIGNLNDDFGNEFNNTDPNKQYLNQRRLFRVAMNGGFTNLFFSNTLANNHSWSSQFGTSRYEPTPTTQLLNPCQAPFSLKMNNDSTKVDSVFAMAVINDNIQSMSFPEMGEYMLDMNLYTQLKADSLARVSNSTWNTFYTSQSDSALGKLYSLDESIQNMELTADSTLALEQIALAKILNNTVVSTRYIEQNEKEINVIYLDYLELGWDNLTSTQKQYTEALAKSCVYTHGYGVYKARLLWSNSEPGLDYNDYRICTSGNNKTNVFGSIFDNVNGDQSDSSNNQILGVQGDIVLYPNPNNGLINLKHNFNAGKTITVDFYDHLSRRIKSVLFSSNEKMTQIDLKGYAHGMYYYIIHIGTEEVKKGKLVILD